MPTLRYATMLSGGKDSCLAHHVAHQWGWDPACAIVVRPRDPESHMFHMPNLELACAQADAMGLPLVELEAPPGEGTETTVLVDAFEAAARDHDADTIVSGAVASEYQRVRIERAAHQVRVKTHAPIWHKDPVAILDTLIAGGFDVRFSAVAAHGLDERWLGRSLDEAARDELVALQAKWGVHPGGEGGEYESVVLDAPLFGRALEVTEAEARWHRDSGQWSVRAWQWAPDAPGRS